MKKIFSLFAIALVFMFVALPFASAEKMLGESKNSLVNNDFETLSEQERLTLMERDRLQVRLHESDDFDNLSEQERLTLRNRLQNRIQNMSGNGSIDRIIDSEFGLNRSENMFRFKFRDKYDELPEHYKRSMFNLSKESQNRLMLLDNESRNKFMELGENRLAELAKLSRGELNKFGTMNKEEIEAKLADYDFDKINRIKNNYKVREITQERFGQLRENFNNVKEEYSEAKGKLQNARERFNELKSSKNLTESVDAAKGYLDAHIDAVIKYLDQVQIKIESNENIDADLASELESEVSALMETLEAGKEKIADAETKDEVKEISLELKEETREVRFAAQAILGKLVGSNMDEVFVRALHLEKKADAIIESLVNEGANVTSLDSLVSEFSEIVADANEMNQEGKDLFDVAKENADENKIQEARELIKASHERLKEAYDVYRELLNEAKDLGYKGQALEYNENTEEYDIVEE